MDATWECMCGFAVFADAGLKNPKCPKCGEVMAKRSAARAQLLAACQEDEDMYGPEDSFD